MSRIAAALGRALVSAGVLILLFAAFQLWGTGVEESRHQSDLAGSLAQATGATIDSGASDEDQADALAATLATRAPAEQAVPDIAVGAGLGVIEIPKIGVKKIMVEGVNKNDLRKGPGHYPGTPLPGQPGNAGVAGHRTTYGAPFNRIDELVPGDQINVYTPQGRFTYEVIAPPSGDWTVIQRGPGWFSVRPKDAGVLAPTLDNRITLTACHPKLSAAQRIIVVARLVDNPAPTTTVPPTAPPIAVASPDDTSVDPPIDTAPGAVDEANDDATIEVAHRDPAGAFDEGLAGDPEAFWPAVLWGLAALGVWMVAWAVRRRTMRHDRPEQMIWRRRFWVWLVFVVPFALPLWFAFFYVDRYLPSF